MMKTPRTDAAMTDGWSGDAFAVPVEFAQELERELISCRDNALEEAALLVERRGTEIGGATQPERTARKIRELKGG